MWPQLTAAITRTKTKLTTTPFTLCDIAKLPIIKEQSRLPKLGAEAHSEL
ncbi:MULTISPECIES: hypothetical protein [unclassified Mycolicibacterium]|nr:MULTISPECIES: hypothetical protein [unclassified Mycolicibacterium]